MNFLGKQSLSSPYQIMLIAAWYIIEHALESRFNPITAIGKTGTFAKNFVNKFNSDAELLDDLVNDLKKT